jgi:serine/threonine protein kinase
MENSLIGLQLDEKYRVDKKLGEGGMGAVYLATHKGTGRPVALKVINPKFMTNKEFIERFKREARAAGLLHHPNIVNVTDFGFAQTPFGQVGYLVMEYLQGCTLGDILKEEKNLPLSWIVDIIEQVCFAVESAHKQGIIHRDLKPDNIWLEPNELGGYRVKVLDFGLAKLTEATKGSDQNFIPINEPPIISSSLVAQNATEVSVVTLAQNTNQEHTQLTQVQEVKTILQTPEKTKQPDKQGELTQVGAILGTPLYMSPEQCSGKKLDARSDIYSLGIITYQMIAGTTPFTGSFGELMIAHCNNPVPSLKEKRPKIPSQIESLIISALAKKPEDRIQSAAAFATALHSRSEGTSELLRKAFSLYSEHFPIFFRLSLIAHLPAVFINLLDFVSAIENRFNIFPTYIFEIIDNWYSLLWLLGNWISVILNSSFFVPIVAQLIISPLRAINIKSSFYKLKSVLRPFFTTSFQYYLRIIPIVSLIFTSILLPWGGLIVFFKVFGIGLEQAQIEVDVNDIIDLGYKVPVTHWINKLCVFILVSFSLIIAYPGIRAFINNSLYPAIVIMEEISGRKVFIRSRELVAKIRPIVNKTIIFYIIIQIIIFATSTVILGILLGKEQLLIHNSKNDGLSSALRDLLSNFISILFNPVISIAFSLLYFKARQTNGETLKQILSSYEKDLPKTKWQERIREKVYKYFSTLTNYSSGKKE